jgi:hypothetical protein
VERSQFIHDTEPAQLDFVFGDLPETAGILRPLEWSQFFAIFHLIGLVLVYDDQRDFALLKAEEHTADRFEGKPLLS